MEEEENNADQGNPLAKMKEEMRNKRGEFNKAQAQQDCKHYLINVLATCNCQCQKGTSNETTRCMCLSFMSGESSAEKVNYVAAYMVHWAEMTEPT
eukprot:14585441-Ditylum_brightwellii.AAC.1